MAYTIKKYDEPAAYQSAYADSINNLVNQTTNNEKFSYNPLSDAAYQSYAQQYNRLGQQANENTMANVATNTGGLASSYAVSAANQAQNQYNQALTDKIPELQELAYNRYNDDRNYNLNAMSTLNDLDTSAYSQYESDRNYDRSNYEYDTDKSYQLNRDNIEDKQWSKNYELDVKNYGLDKANLTYNKMLNSWTTLGYANKQVAAYFHVKKGTKTSDQRYRDATLKKASTTSSSSGRRSSGSSRSGSGSSGNSKGGNSGGNKGGGDGNSNTSKGNSSSKGGGSSKSKGLTVSADSSKYVRNICKNYNAGKLTKWQANSQLSLVGLKIKGNKIVKR